MPPSDEGQQTREALDSLSRVLAVSGYEEVPENRLLAKSCSGFDERVGFLVRAARQDLDRERSVGGGWVSQTHPEYLRRKKEKSPYEAAERLTTYVRGFLLFSAAERFQGGQCRS